MIRARLVVVALAVSAPAAHAGEPAKKDRVRADKAPFRGTVPAAGRKPAKLVNLYNTWTHEWLALEPGAGVPQPTIDRFLRDHYTNAPAPMEPRLVEILLAAATHFRSDTVFVVSAFRHPKYNLILRKKGHQVARDSHHTKGDAVDFYIPRVTTQRLHAWAKAQGIGGVGRYLGSGFVHMDTGKVRYWNGE